MSSLLRPVGRLPASVYWFRRGLLGVVAVVLLVLLVNLFGGGGEDPKNTAATDPGQTPSSGPSADPTTTPTSTPTDRPTTGRTTPGGTGKATGKPSTPTTPKDAKCTGSDVRIDLIPAARAIASGAALNFGIQLTALGAECKASIDPTVLSLTIASGKDQIWTSTQCEQVIPRTTFPVAKGKVSGTTVLWNGRRSAPGCLPGQLLAKPGTYVAKAVYDGQASATQAFQIG